jgi:8-oxo-dGTP pyrophosphatase MutT (NUDIX family)
MHKEACISCGKSATHLTKTARWSCEACTDTPKKIRTVTVLIIKDHKILGISRGANLQDWGLIGGGVEEYDADDETAALREMKEESGYSTTHLFPIFHSTEVSSKDLGKSVSCTTFLATGVLSGSEAERTHGHEGALAWLYPKDLYSVTCTFANYNRELFNSLLVKPLIR